MTRNYFLQSFLIHAGLLGILFCLPMFRSSPQIFWVDGFDYAGDGGGGGGGSSGPKAAQMGQVVPEPVKMPLPQKPAPIQKAVKGEETWKVKDAKEQKTPAKPVAVPDENVERGEKNMEAKSNIIRKGVAEGTVAGEGAYDFGTTGEGTGGAGIGIGMGPGNGGGFGFGSYLRVMRQRIWAEWTQSAVYGSKLSAVVGLTVAMNGEVSDIKLENSSGNAFYDNVALRAVRNASPLPPLPPNFPKSTQRFNINFRLQD